MPRQRIWDLEKAGQEEPPPYHQHHEDPATPTAVTSRGWFTSLRRSLRRRLGFDAEDFRLTPLLTTPAAVQDGSELWPDLFTIPESNDVDLVSPPGLVDSPPPGFVDDSPPVVKHSIHTFFCNPQFHSTKGQVKSTATVHLALCWYQTASYIEIPPTWRGHLADFAISDEISVTLDPLCPTRKVFTRAISIEYQRGHSEGEPEFLVLRPRDSKSRAEARVQVSVSCRSREWLSNEPPDNFSNLIYKDAAVV